MTLGGLALAVGILVDQVDGRRSRTFTRHLRKDVVARRAPCCNATREVIGPLLLAMLCVLAVFVPSFFMTGVRARCSCRCRWPSGSPWRRRTCCRARSCPCCRSGRFDRIALVVARSHRRSRSSLKDGLHGFRPATLRMLQRLVRVSWLVIAGYLAATAAIVGFLGPRLGLEIFPQVSAGQFQLRLRAPAGTRVDLTEALSLKILDEIKETVGPENVEITLGYVGTQPASAIRSTRSTCGRAARRRPCCRLR